MTDPPRSLEDLYPKLVDMFGEPAAQTLMLRLKFRCLEVSLDAQRHLHERFVAALGEQPAATFMELLGWDVPAAA